MCAELVRNNAALPAQLATMELACAQSCSAGPATPKGEHVCAELGSVGHHGFSFAHKAVAAPLVIAGEAGARTLFGGYSLALHAHQLVVRGEVRQACAPELIYAAEAVLAHEGLPARDKSL